MTRPREAPPLLLPAPRLVEDRSPWQGWHQLSAPLRIEGFPAYIEHALALLGPLLPCAWATAGGAGTLTVDGDPPHPALGGAEAYRLCIDPGRINLQAGGDAGMVHGLRTLAQLVAQYGRSLPCLLIEDAPAFAVRGVMLDISRDRVPTMAHLLATVDLLASWKINHLQLYTEHTFAYAGHEQVWRDASPMTAAEIRELDAHCRGRGIELAANQNCFGHLASWLKHPRYAPLAEIAPDGSWDFNGLVTRQGPFSLCPSDPGALALVEDLLGQLLPNFTSPLVNIGCDETFDVGQGRSRDDVARRGRAEVYLEFVRKVCAVARRHGRRPQFWADIALEHPEALGGLPEDLAGLAWGYEPDAPFARWCDQLRRAGREVWVCPGTSCWRSITGRTAERRGNLLAAARDGAAHGASGYLATAWGDLGHRQQWPITLHALAEAAHRAWSGEAPYDPRASSLHAFGDRSLGIAAWLDGLGDADLELRRIAGRPGPDGKARPLRNATALFTDLHKPLDEAWAGDAAAWEALLPALERACGTMPRAADIGPLVVRELLLTAQVALLAATRGTARRSGEARSAAASALRGMLPPIIDQHRETWLARSRPGGLDASCAHYQRLLDELGPA
jgi:hypothetical protein